MKTVNLQFGSKAHMLDTLRLAYQYALDASQDKYASKRLTPKEGRELGARLAKYWLDKSLTERPKIGTKILVPQEAANDIKKDFEAKVISYSSCSDSCVEVKPKGKGMNWIVDWTVCKAL